MDFTIDRYKNILETFKKEKYFFSTFEDFIRKTPKGRVIILRHDVDRFPNRALELARIEGDLNVRATYYFRTKKGVLHAKIIEEIVELGHEVGYHYEDLCSAKGDVERAILLFEANLDKLRKFYPVSTICMHGNPLSKFDNKLIWEKYDYRDFGIIGEIYRDVDYSRVLYITDTGRRWNDYTVNIRDRVEGLKTGPIKSSKKILDWVSSKQLNDIVMLNTHPDRWRANLILWIFDAVFQFLKNRVKSQIIKFRKIT